METPIVVRLFKFMEALNEHPDAPVTHADLIHAVHTLMEFVDKARQAPGHLDITVNTSQLSSQEQTPEAPKEPAKPASKAK